MGLSRSTLWKAEAMATEKTSDAVWTDGDNWSAQVYSAIDTRAGTLYLEGTDDGPDEASPVWTTITSFAVGAGVLLNRLTSVGVIPTAGVRLRWEPSAGVGIMKATVCVQRLAEE